MASTQEQEQQHQQQHHADDPDAAFLQIALDEARQGLEVEGGIPIGACLVVEEADGSRKVLAIWWYC